MKHAVKRSISTLTRSSAAVACFLAIAVVVLAQEYRGSISGQVTEASGSAVHGAKVTVTELATNTSTTTTTNDSGHYTVLYLNPGRYSVAVEATGFRKLVQSPIEVRVADALTLDLKLEVGSVSEVL